uniref:Uncharacterized protein n=1 Tax=Kwoniella dejecticola CBS 10117 TaxID=1296121 RepID=A0A1A6ADC9_9TREE|nr:uncharacterized protein I303_02278 [Kwoniella dejecticola CBS 10117]OBR88059.1 hypothetical protein I303_02278 [Kwoniella dejecticola CBS 10117]
MYYEKGRGKSFERASYHENHAQAQELKEVKATLAVSLARTVQLEVQVEKQQDVIDRQTIEIQNLKDQHEKDLKSFEGPYSIKFKDSEGSVQASLVLYDDPYGRWCDRAVSGMICIVIGIVIGKM